MATPFVSRAQWGARPPKNTTLLAAAGQLGVAIHYSAAEADRVTDHAGCAARVRGIQAFHMDGRGWADIAYSWLTCGHGVRFAGRGLGIRTAAQGTNAGNDGWHAVCFLGLDKAGRTDITAEAKNAIRDCILTVRARYPAATGVRPHSWFHSTECPGDELRAWITAGIPPITPAATVEDDMYTDADRDRDEDIRARLISLVTPGEPRSLRERIDDIERAEIARWEADKAWKTRVEKHLGITP